MFSPWRSDHLESFLEEHGGGAAKSDDSPFSRIANSGDDPSNFVLWRGEAVFVVMNLYPYNPGQSQRHPYAADDWLVSFDASILPITVFPEAIDLPRSYPDPP